MLAIYTLISCDKEKDTTPDRDKIYLTADGKITGGEIFGEKIPSELTWVLTRMDSDNENDSYSPVTYPYANKNFDITLSTPTANQLGALVGQSTSLTMTPGDMKFSSAALLHANGYIELTNIAWQNISDVNSENNYKVKKGEGYVRFIYASKAGIVNGTLVEETEAKQTIVFTNCQFRQGWNEMVVIATQDAAADGSVTINITANNTPSTFKWVTQSGNKDIEQPE